MGNDTGSNLAALRAARGLSQEQLAAQMGVSRQAVSNWERSESLPDTANLIRLSELYGVTLDQLVGQTPIAPEREHARQGVSASVGHIGSTASRIATLIVCVALSATYYAFLAQPLLRSTVDDLTEMFGLALGPSLAMLWLVAEVVFVLLPFVLIAVAPAKLPRLIWLAPLAMILTPLLVSLGGAAMSGAAVIEYSGIGGVLGSSVAIKADILSLVAGSALVDLVKRRPWRQSSI